MLKNILLDYNDMKFVHGSPHNILESAEGKFKLFDHVYCPNNGPSGLVSSGMDSYGPGIYAFPGERTVYTESIKAASTHSGKGNGFVYVLNVDVDKKSLLNKRDAWEIDSEIWIEIVDEFITLRRNDASYHEDKLNSAKDEIINLHESTGVTPDKVKEIFSSNGFSMFDFDYLDISEYEHSSEWEDQVSEQFSLYDPCSNIFNEGGKESVVEYAMNKSDTLWDVLSNLWNSIAVSGSGTGYKSYNETFQRAATTVFHRNEICDFKVAEVNNEYQDHRFYVIFDLDSISIDKVISLNLEKTDESDLSM